MADKSFGVKDINLIGASGTPEIESPNNLNIKAVNVAISTDMSVGGELTVTDTFLKPQAVGLGTTTATGRDAGISTSTGTVIYIPTVGMQVYAGDDGWKTISGTAVSTPDPLTATGGTKTTDGLYTVHTFLSSQNFAVTSGSGSIEYLVVAGGGGGGSLYQGGGGGAGGLRTNLAGHPLSTNNPSFTVSPTGGNGSGTYTVSIGGGGAGATDAGSAGTNGVDSYFGPPSIPAAIVSKGGGGAGGYAQDGLPGGSGGGSGDKSGTAIGGYGYNPSTPAPIVPNIPSSHPYGITQGNNGGGSTGTYGAPYIGGGGGGAGGNGLGSDGSNIQSYEGNGGLGSQVLIAGPSSHPGVGAVGPNGQEQWYCGGGGAGGYVNAPSTAGDGGAGPATNAPTSGWSGGGPGGPNGTGATGNGVGGTGNSGGGGGGAVSPNSPYSGTGGTGGSGIVIIRYLT